MPRAGTAAYSISRRPSGLKMTGQGAATQTMPRAGVAAYITPRRRSRLKMRGQEAAPGTRPSGRAGVVGYAFCNAFCLLDLICSLACSLLAATCSLTCSLLPVARWRSFPSQPVAGVSCWQCFRAAGGVGYILCTAFGPMAGEVCYTQRFRLLASFVSLLLDLPS